MKLVKVNVHFFPFASLSEKENIVEIQKAQSPVSFIGTYSSNLAGRI